MSSRIFSFILLPPTPLYYSFKLDDITTTDRKDDDMSNPIHRRVRYTKLGSTPAACCCCRCCSCPFRGCGGFLLVFDKREERCRYRSVFVSYSIYHSAKDIRPSPNDSIAANASPSSCFLLLSRCTAHPTHTRIERSFRGRGREERPLTLLLLHRPGRQAGREAGRGSG